jgi:hypothetical protein
MTPVVGGDGKAVEPLLDFFVETLDSDLCVEDVQNVPHRDVTGVFETFLMQRSIDLLSFREAFL